MHLHLRLFQITPKGPNATRTALDALTGRGKGKAAAHPEPSQAHDPNARTPAAEYLESKRAAVLPPRPEPLHVASSRALQDLMTPLKRQSRDDVTSPTAYLDISGGGSSVSTHRSDDDQFLQELEAGAMSASAQPAWLSGGSSYGSQHSISTSPRQQRDRGASNSGNQPRPPDVMHHRTSSSGSVGSDYGDDESYSNDSGSSAASGDERQPPRHHHQQQRQRQQGHHRRPTNGPVQPGMGAGMMTRENFRPPVPMPIGMPPDPFAASPFPPDPFAPPSNAHASLDAFMPPQPALFQMDSFMAGPVVPSQPYPHHQQQQFYGGGAGYQYPLGPDGLATIHSDSEQEGTGHSRRHGQGGRPSTSSSQHQHQSQSPPTEQRRAKIEKERTMAGFSRRPPSRPKQGGRV